MSAVSCASGDGPFRCLGIARGAEPSGAPERARLPAQGKTVVNVQPDEWDHPWPMTDCLACDLASGDLPLPGGVISETAGWRVEHCIGPLGVGTLIVKPRRHVLQVADLTEDEALEMGTLLRVTAEAVRDLTAASQVYVCLWSHGPVHIHFVVQPVFADAIAEFGASGPSLQAAMFSHNRKVDPSQVADFAERARAWFADDGA